MYTRKPSKFDGVAIASRKFAGLRAWVYSVEFSAFFVRVDLRAKGLDAGVRLGQG